MGAEWEKLSVLAENDISKQKVWQGAIVFLKDV